MANVITFKKHQSRTGLAESFEGLPDHWRLREFRQSSDKADDRAIIDLFGDLEKREECRFFHLINPRGKEAASFAVRMASKWVERTAFNQNVHAGETLQALAKLYRTNQWLTLFEWAHGYVFGHDGKAYSVNALPDAIEIQGSVSIKDRSQISLPPMFVVVGDLEISHTTVSISPRYIKCCNLSVSGSTMEEAARRLAIIGTVEITDSTLTRVCHTATIDGDLRLTRIKRRTEMPEACTIAGNLVLEDTDMDIHDQNIVIGGIVERRNDSAPGYLGKDFLNQLLAPGSSVKFLNLLQRDKFGYPINIQNTNCVFGTFICTNADGSYTCSIDTTEPTRFVDVRQMDIIGVRKVAAPPTL